MLINTSKSKISIKSFNKATGTPILFIHGFTGSYASWEEIKKTSGRYAYALDIPGHGGSFFKDINESYTISDWCSELYILLHTLNINLPFVRCII